MTHFQQGWNLQYKYYTMYMQHSYTQIEQWKVPLKFL